MENHLNNNLTNKENSEMEKEYIENSENFENKEVFIPEESQVIIEEEKELTEEDQILSDIEELEEKDYSLYSKKELIEQLKQLISEKDIDKIKPEVEKIRVQFYKTLKQEHEELRKKFLEQGGKLEDFVPPVDELEKEFKNIYNAYREKRKEYIEEIEKQKEENYRKKMEIIEKIKGLINKPESLKTTLDEFYELTRMWKEIGIVPKEKVKQLYEDYNFARDQFYNWLKLNREAKELDYKKNLEAKIALCEQAEALLNETDITKSLSKLQLLHAQWREIGPVYPDKKEEIWHRFKEITKQIHQKHQEYFKKKREEEETNLRAKIILCEIAEDIANQNITTVRQWKEETEKILDIQRRWKTIGNVPRNQASAIYKRLRAAIDKFFANKNEFFQQKIEEEKKNYQIKLDYCLRAEALKDSTDWKNTTLELIKLQKEWKKIGKAPAKENAILEERFRKACNEFFERKSQHFKSLENLLKENLQKKKEILNTLKNFTISENFENDLERLKAIQKQWFEIGPVGQEHQEEIQNQYKSILQELYNKLNIDDKKKAILNIKLKVDEILKQNNPLKLLQHERNQLAKELFKIENDLKTIENNISFFSKSKNTESIIAEFKERIDKGNKDKEILKEQIKYIDQFIKQLSK